MLLASRALQQHAAEMEHGDRPLQASNQIDVVLDDDHAEMVDPGERRAGAREGDSAVWDGYDSIRKLNSSFQIRI
jgi:hypothetical protein